MLLRSAEPTLDGPQVFVLGGDVLLAVWDGPDAPSDAIAIETDGKIIGRRRATLRLNTTAGSVRTLVAFHAAGLSAGAAITIKHGSRALPATIDDSSADLPALTSALSEGGQARLAGFVMGVCRGTFRLSETAKFAAFCQYLLQACTRGPTIQFRADGHLAAGHIFYTAAAPAGLGSVEAVFASTDQRVIEFPFRPSAGSSAEGGETRLALIAPRWAAARGLNNVLVAGGGLATVELLPTGGIPNVASLAEQKRLSAAERHYVLRSLGTLGDNEAAAAARALQILAPEPVRDIANTKHPICAMLEFTASCGDAGVFVQGWIRDRNSLVQDAELVSPFGIQPLRDRWHRLPRPDLQKSQGTGTDRGERAGFVALAPIHEPLPVLQHGLRVVTAGGTITTASPLKVLSDMEARNAVLSAVHPNELKPKLLAEVIAPAAAALHRRVMAGQSAPEIIEIGEQKPNPAVSFIIPLYRNLSFMRLQTSAFSVDPEIGRDVELIYVLDSPEQKGELEHLLRGLHVVTGLSFRLVVMAANFGYAAANNTGVRAARGNTLMLMNSDVIPIGANWLRSLRTALRLGTPGCPVGAVGPKLIFDDGSLQHAGLTFERDIDGRWYNTHFFKGYPRDWPAANVSRSVPGITGAAMLMPRAIYEEIGGFSEDYVVGDYEDSDLCLKLRSKGYDIRYEPRAELYHFERRSITLHTGYVNTAASSYNRALHAGRWSDLMEQVTAGEELSAEETFAESEQKPLEPVLSGGVG